MILQPFYTSESGCAAYIVGCGGKGKCAVVDGHKDDVERYLAFASAKGMAITHVIDTHVHADHMSCGRFLSERTGALYCLHASAVVAFEFAPMEDGQQIELGNVRIDVLHTPGHTPESVCLVVTDLRRGTDPWFVLTGDTLFVGAVGRPDLPGDAARCAHDLHVSLHEKLLVLPDGLEIFPAHFSGSACGAGLSGKPMSTIGFEKRWNSVLSLDRESFVETVGANILERPAGMELIVQANQGR